MSRRRAAAWLVSGMLVTAGLSLRLRGRAARAAGSAESYRHALGLAGRSRIFDPRRFAASMASARTRATGIVARRKSDPVAVACLRAQNVVAALSCGGCLRAALELFCRGSMGDAGRGQLDPGGSACSRKRDAVLERDGSSHRRQAPAITSCTWLADSPQAARSTWWRPRRAVGSSCLRRSAVRGQQPFRCAFRCPSESRRGQRGTEAVRWFRPLPRGRDTEVGVVDRGHEQQGRHAKRPCDRDEFAIVTLRSPRSSGSCLLRPRFRSLPGMPRTRVPAPTRGLTRRQRPATTTSGKDPERVVQ